VSTPASSLDVASKWRNVWGVVAFLIPTARDETFSRAMSESRKKSELAGQSERSQRGSTLVIPGAGVHEPLRNGPVPRLRFILLLACERARRTTAVTGPPPRNYDFRIRVIGGSG
jgi:hypothetical protein